MAIPICYEFQSKSYPIYYSALPLPPPSPSSIHIYARWTWIVGGTVLCVVPMNWVPCAFTWTVLRIGVEPLVFVGETAACPIPVVYFTHCVRFLQYRLKGVGFARYSFLVVLQSELFGASLWLLVVVVMERRREMTIYRKATQR